jgi:hypothetical protein
MAFLLLVTLNTILVTVDIDIYTKVLLPQMTLAYFSFS